MREFFGGVLIAFSIYLVAPDIGSLKGIIATAALAVGIFLVSSVVVSIDRKRG